MFDQFRYGYLGFGLGPDGHTIYYLTGGAIEDEDEAAGFENLHLITYYIPGRRYTDHGPIFFSDGKRPAAFNSIAIGQDGYLYSVGKFEFEGKRIHDLIKFPNPLYRTENKRFNGSLIKMDYV